MTKNNVIFNESNFDEYLKLIKKLKEKGDFTNRPELYVSYDKQQKNNYFNHPESCIYSQWDKPWGIHRIGRNFPVMVAQKFLKDKNYNVFLSGAKSDGYALVRYKKSRERYPGYQYLLKLFPDKIKTVINEAHNTNLIGGDPDIFVSKNLLSTSFFIEVKEKDDLTDNQTILFPIIEKYLCPVLLIRVIEK